MDMEELEPRKAAAYELGGDLSTISIEELKELTERLKAEIARIEHEIKAKESSRDAAASVFKS
ncbi:MAG: DUF1192 domain-containing protein [Hyphomicrobiaceae bacterium]|nr:DUF1192 domain-containing protein [Hyphomicrobiaceae bacterium]